MLNTLLIDTAPTINIWSFLIPILLTLATSAIVALVNKFFSKPKDNAETNKLKAETEKVKVETDALEIEEWRKLYGEIKDKYKELKRESEEFKKQIAILSQSIDVQEEVTGELKKDLDIERNARQKLEGIIKKFQAWAIRNKDRLEEAKIEAIPMLINNGNGNGYQ